MNEQFEIQHCDADADPDRPDADFVDEPARPAIEPFRPFPVHALPKPLRSFAVAVADATGTDPCFASLAVLVTAAGCIGNRAAILLQSGWSEPAVLWGAMVGRSGSTKSPVLRLVTRGALDLYKAGRRAYQDALAEYETEKLRYDVEMTRWKQDQRKGPPTDPPLAPEMPKEERLVVSDSTIEKLGALLEENPLGLLLVRDELAAWVGSFDRYSAGKGGDAPAWLSFYDASPVTIDRKSGPTMFVERGAVSILGTVQPGTLRRVFGRAEREAGLLARVLLVYPPERPALWSDSPLPDQVADEWRDLLADLQRMPHAVDEHGDPRPQYLRLDDDARRLWIEWQNAHAVELTMIGNDDLAASFAKLKGVAARIALVFAVVRVASTGDPASFIGKADVQGAIKVVQWLKQESARVYALLAEDDADRERRSLLELISRRGGTVTPRELVQTSRMFATVAEARGELDGLADAGFGHWEHPAPGPQGGRPVARFRLSPSVYETETPAGDPVAEGFVDGPLECGDPPGDGAATVVYETPVDEGENGGFVDTPPGGLFRGDTEPLDYSDWPAQ